MSERDKNEAAWREHLGGSGEERPTEMCGKKQVKKAKTRELSQRPVNTFDYSPTSPSGRNAVD